MILLQLQSTVDVVKKCSALRSLRWSNLEGCMFEDYTQSGYAGAGRNWGIFVDIPKRTWLTLRAVHQAYVKGCLGKTRM